MASNYRKGLIASIHIARKDLGLDDETYRELLFNVTGEVSSAKCGVKQLCAMLGELRKKGWKPKPPAEDPLVPLRKKIRAQCHALDAPMEYADAIISRQTRGLADLKTATREQLRACVSALAVRQRRMAEANDG
jgi:hypothetical protein